MNIAIEDTNERKVIKCGGRRLLSEIAACRNSRRGFHKRLAVPDDQAL
ncbi:hypothetical protein KCP70_15775 [Salmonella enterica subsp. enterica]|nr:hypothetical protein KCP70_15775 [Salmonella enterica subsp. enterica]